MIELEERLLDILLVDDEPERAALGRRLERRSGRYRVRHVLSLEEARGALAEETFDIVLCDFILGGDQTARALVDAVVSSGLPTKIIVFSAYVEGEHKEELLRAGAFWYLAKPIVFAELVHTIETIEAFQRQQELGESSSRLAQISSRFHATLQLDEVTHLAVEAALQLGFRRARLYLLDEEGDCLVGQSSAGMSPEIPFVGYRLPLSGSGLIDRIFHKRKPTAWSLTRSREYATELDLEWITELGLREVPWLDCPLLVSDQRVGTLSVDCCGAPNPSLTPLQKETMGVLAGMVAQAVNNCQLYQAEALARASLDRILADAPDAIITTALDGTIDFVSLSAESIFGIPPSELMRRKASDVYIDPSDPPAGQPSTAEAVMADLRAGKPVQNRPVTVRGREGRPLALSLSASLLREREGGEVVGTLGILKSMGYAEQQFEEYRNLIEGFGYGMAILTKDGKVSFLNRKAQRLLGQASGTVLGRSLGEVLRPADAAKLAEGIDEMRTSEEARPLKVEAGDSSGRTVPLELYLSPIRLGARLTGIAVGLYDRREQERLIWAGRLAALGEMVGALAHEINNPLNNIQTAADTLADSLGEEARDEDRDLSLKVIVHGVDRIAELVRRLRRLSRKRPTAYVRLDLNHLLEDFVAFFDKRLRATRIAVEAVRLSAPRPN